MTTETIAREDGDVHDGDTGDYYFTLEQTAGLPATLDILHQGYWYTYKIEGRREDKPEEPDISVPAEDNIEPQVVSLNTKDPLKDL
jgi:hypothetical protein